MRRFPPVFEPRVNTLELPLPVRSGTFAFFGPEAEGGGRFSQHLRPLSRRGNFGRPRSRFNYSAPYRTSCCLWTTGSCAITETSSNRHIARLPPSSEWFIFPSSLLCLSPREHGCPAVGPGSGEVTPSCEHNIHQWLLNQPPFPSGHPPASDANERQK